MDNKDREEIKEESPIKIDYENLDVASIMDQIKEKIARQPRKSQELHKIEPIPSSPSYVSYQPEEAVPGYRKRIKKIIFKIMRPFSPLIKLLVLPVHEEVMETVSKLHQTNQRLDSLNQSLEKSLGEVLAHTDKGFDEIHQRLNLAYENLYKTMEYVKLLHNLSHNIVVELSKLKIEEETLKSKTRIIEKDFEFLGEREKALEKRIFK